MYLVPIVLRLNTLQTIWNFGGDFGEVTKGEESDSAETENGKGNSEIGIYDCVSYFCFASKITFSIFLDLREQIYGYQGEKESDDMESCTKATDMEPSEPLGNCCSKHHPPSLPAKIRQKFPPWYSPYYHNQSRNANLPAGIFFDLRLQKLVMNPGKTSTLPGLSGGVSPLHWQCPHYFCSLFLINSLLSAILCVWKFFSNPC